MTGNVNKTDGLNYLFMMMSANYGANFVRHWDGSDMSIVKKFWIDTIGDHLTNKKVIDYAISRLDRTFIPTALAFLDLCDEYKEPKQEMLFTPAIQEIRSEEEMNIDSDLAQRARQALFEFARRNRRPTKKITN